MKIEMTERAFILMLHSLEHYAKHLNDDEEDPGPNGEDAMYLWWLRDELKKEFIGPDSKVKPELLP